MKDDEINNLRVQLAKETKMYESLNKKTKELEERRAEVEKARDASKADNVALDREIEKQKKRAEQDKKQIEELTREKELLHYNWKKTDQAKQKQQDLLKIQENTRKTLEQEIASYQAEAQRQRKQIYQLEKEREKYG